MKRCGRPNALFRLLRARGISPAQQDRRLAPTRGSVGAMTTLRIGRHGRTTGINSVLNSCQSRENRILTTSVKCAARVRIGRPGQLMAAAALLLLQFGAEALPTLRDSGRGLLGKPADAARGVFAGKVDRRTGPVHSHRTASEPLRLYGGKRRDMPKPRGVRKGEVSTLKVPVFELNSCTLWHCLCVCSLAVKLSALCHVP
jgi:hypothetical protein